MALARAGSDMCGTKCSFRAIRSTFGDLFDYEIYSCAACDSQSKERGFVNTDSTVAHVALRGC